ncbi:MAG: hypothetical protein ACM3MD_04545 [Betaproteobacteria bacterium]
MKKQYLLASAVSEVGLNISADKLDLPHWLFRLSDPEYQQCSKGHFGAGVSTLPSGKRTSVNVESVGGHFAIQHYIEDISRRNHLKLVSERSDVWIYHFFHIHPRVTWEMKLIPTSDHSCIFQDTVSIEHSSLFIKILSVLCLVPLFVKRHDDEETKLFAANLAQSA